jgi:7,8-dihydropterin-6-yl-methyl-4-(beta-D-ribofuranosyl)aminobenzene 5'-phosphate synthase
MSKENLREVQRVEVIPLCDNVVERSSDPRRPDVKLPKQWVRKGGTRPAYLWAGHGIAILVKVYEDDKMHQVLYDTGPSAELIAHNVEVLGIDLKKTEAIVMSHGHWDHFGGLLWVLNEIGKDTPVYVHRRMFSDRRVVSEGPDGKIIRDLDSVPTADKVMSAGGKLVWITEPTLLANNTLMRSGEVQRVTDFEKGVIGHQALVGGSWQHDEAIIDDGYLIANVKEKGLVVITGCSHAGIINMLKDAQRISGINKIHAVIGGFHLIGRDNVHRVTQTIWSLKDFNHKMLVPSHCTGWRGQHRIAREFPDAYAASSVWRLYIIE